jgi:hypothetical protein
MKPALDILLITNRNSKVRSFEINPRRAALLALITIIALCGGKLTVLECLFMKRNQRKHISQGGARPETYQSYV